MKSRVKCKQMIKAYLNPAQSRAFQILLVENLQQVVLLHHLFLQSVIKLLPT